MRHARSDELAISNLKPHASIVLKMLYQVGEASNVSPLKGIAGVGSLVMEQCIVSILSFSLEAQVTVFSACYEEPGRSQAVVWDCLRFAQDHQWLRLWASECDSNASIFPRGINTVSNVVLHPGEIFISLVGRFVMLEQPLNPASEKGLSLAGWPGRPMQTFVSSRCKQTCYGRQCQNFR